MPQNVCRIRQTWCPRERRHYTACKWPDTPDLRHGKGSNGGSPGQQPRLRLVSYLFCSVYHQRCITRTGQSKDCIRARGLCRRQESIHFCAAGSGESCIRAGANLISQLLCVGFACHIVCLRRIVGLFKEGYRYVMTRARWIDGLEPVQKDVCFVCLIVKSSKDPGAGAGRCWGALLCC